jgi:hypothetical protein
VNLPGKHSVQVYTVAQDVCARCALHRLFPVLHLVLLVLLLLLQAALPQYESLFSEYVALAASQRREVDLSLALDPQRLLGHSSHLLGGSSNLLTAAPHHAAAAAGYDACGRGAGSSTRGAQQQLQLTGRLSSGGLPAAAAAGGSGGGAAVAGSASRHRNSAHLVGSGQEIRAEDGSAVPQEVRRAGCIAVRHVDLGLVLSS